MIDFKALHLSLSSVAILRLCPVSQPQWWAVVNYESDPTLQALDITLDCALEGILNPTSCRAAPELNNDYIVVSSWPRKFPVSHGKS
ncbi:hypothetical protein B0I35DRAFT_194775 [Stachybotrys elegans]|uniref:Uncharacterized protein n=1 Tax=Stachybotrys elegans TaxID=80388 RepID=A0A8K0SX48_9HYPO|nr:hypothetical protein B0I35DRAFT_194775 [Stachybotrys elegans]